jgi:hypothetical protein
VSTLVVAELDVAITESAGLGCGRALANVLEPVALLLPSTQVARLR